MGDARRFPSASTFRAFTGLAPKASETGNTDRKGQPISKAGNRLLRTTLHRAADNARHLDPQLARLYYVQMVQRGKDHLGAVQGGRRAPGRAGLDGHGPRHAVRGLRHRRHPGHPEQAKQIITERWTVPEEVRRRRRSRKTKGKAPHQVLEGHVSGAQGATRRPSPPASLGRQGPNVKPLHQPA
jgi:Transposase IS116/IS110/IS902 family